MTIWVENSEHPVQSKVIKASLDDKIGKNDVVGVYNEQTKKLPFTSEFVHNELGKKFDKDNLDKEMIENSDNAVQSKVIQTLC